MNIKCAEIDKSDENFPRIVLEVDGVRHSFTVKDYPEKHYPWLCSILTRIVVDVYGQGRKEGIKCVTEPLKKALWFLNP